MHGDGFGCLHTEDISGHKIEGLPFFAKKHPPLHICPARCGRKFEGNPIYVSFFWPLPPVVFLGNVIKK